MARIARLALAGALLLAALLPAAAPAGIDPSPFRVLVSNRSDLVAPDSPFHALPMRELTVFVEVEYGGDPGAIALEEIQYPIAGVAIAAGESFAASFDVKTSAPGGRIIGWGFTARMGVDPSPFRVYAMAGPADAPPAYVPTLPPRLLSGFDLVAFASPGTVVGTVLVSFDAMTAPCPPDASWKNHGQYVRCVSFRVADLTALGEITEDEADAIVSAAARSGVGK